MATATQAPATAGGPTSHTQNALAGLAKLREPFPKDQVQQLPKILCRACSESRTKVCENPQHQKTKCRDCGNFITSAHLHLDYVGHAELTHRLLDADPLWGWEPVAFGPDGLPAFDRNGGLWIRLTVCGHTRLGYGDSQGKTGPNAVKEAIGDALRNAAMRFGAALDLWAKSDLKAAQSEHPKSAEDDIPQTRTEPSAHRPAGTAPAADQPSPAEQAVDAVQAALLDKLMQQVRDNWNHVLVLQQIRGEADAKGLLDAKVQGPGGAWMPMHILLDGRISQLAAEKGAA